MKNNKEMIEEMVEHIKRVIYNTEPDHNGYRVPRTVELAEELLKHYQPKLPEGSVVLSRDDYGAMEIKIEQLTKYAENERQLREYYCNEARKEMIEKIYRKGKELDKYFGKTELGEYLMANYISRNNSELK